MPRVIVKEFRRAPDRAKTLRFRVRQVLGPDAQDALEKDFEAQQELALNGGSPLPRVGLSERLATEGRRD